MDITINVGKYEVVNTGDIDVFEKNDVVLNIGDNDSLKMKFVFKDNKEDEKTYFEREVNGNILTWRIVNMNRNYSVLGMDSPELIGEFDNGKGMYFSFSIRAIHVEKGIYNLKYVFWKEK